MIDFTVKMREKEVKELAESMTSWNKIAEIIPDMSEEDLWKCIKVESLTLKRTHVINRLKGKLNKIRNLRENNEIFGFIYKKSVDKR